MKALNVLSDCKSTVDLIISDIEMPEMDSYERARRVHYGTDKDIPVLMLTGQNTDDHVQKTRLHKIEGYIVKPKKLTTLKPTCEEIWGYNDE